MEQVLRNLTQDNRTLPLTYSDVEDSVIRC